MSWHQDWDISNQPLLSSQRAVLSQLKCTQSVRNILRFQHPKMAPPQKMAEKILSILVWFTSCLSAAWACLKPFDWFWGKNKKAQNLHVLKAISSRHLFCLWSKRRSCSFWWVALSHVLFFFVCFLVQGGWGAGSPKSQFKNLLVQAGLRWICCDQGCVYTGQPPDMPMVHWDLRGFRLHGKENR